MSPSQTPTGKKEDPATMESPGTREEEKAATAKKAGMKLVMGALGQMAGRMLVSKLTAEEAKGIKEEVIQPVAVSEPGGSAPAGGTVIRRLVGEGAAELIKKLNKQAKEPGKAAWSNTHFILVFDCSGIYASS
jgi:hypothetical protein